MLLSVDIRCLEMRKTPGVANVIGRAMSLSVEIGRAVLLSVVIGRADLLSVVT